MRERRTEELVETTNYQIGNWQGDITNGEYSSRVRRTTMFDVVTPRYRARMSEGEIINNPMAYASYRQTSNVLKCKAYGIYETDESDLIYEGQTPITHPSIVDPFPSGEFSHMAIMQSLEPLENERDVATTAAWADVNVTEAQLLASLGEMPATIRWINSLTRRGVSTLRLLAKKKSLLALGKTVLMKHKAKGMKRNIRDSADFWMEVRYALRPLVYEMVQATTALNTYVKLGARITARGYHEVTDTTSENQAFQSAMTEGNIRHTCVRHSRYRAGVLYNIGEDINDVMALWGIDKPLEALWEITTLSFVLDWFFNVGPTLASWSINPSLTPLTSWLSEEHVWTYKSMLKDYDDRSFESPYNWDDIRAPIFDGSETIVHIKARTPCPPRAFLPNLAVKLDFAKTLDLAIIGKGILNGLMETPFEEIRRQNRHFTKVKRYRG